MNAGLKACSTQIKLAFHRLFGLYEFPVASAAEILAGGKDFSPLELGWCLAHAAPVDA
jgi:hypothetical protein